MDPKFAQVNRAPISSSVPLWYMYIVSALDERIRYFEVQNVLIFLILFHLHLSATVLLDLTWKDSAVFKPITVLFLRANLVPLAIIFMMTMYAIAHHLLVGKTAALCVPPHPAILVCQTSVFTGVSVLNHKTTPPTPVHLVHGQQNIVDLTVNSRQSMSCPMDTQHFQVLDLL